MRRRPPSMTFSTVLRKRQRRQGDSASMSGGSTICARPRSHRRFPCLNRKNVGHSTSTTRRRLLSFVRASRRAITCSAVSDLQRVGGHRSATTRQELAFPIVDVRHLDPPPISAHLFRISFDTLRRSRFSSPSRLRKRMLLVSRTVADALERTVSIRGARVMPIGTDSVISVLVLPGCSARLADIYK